MTRTHISAVALALTLNAAIAVGQVPAPAPPAPPAVPTAPRPPQPPEPAPAPAPPIPFSGFHVPEFHVPEFHVPEFHIPEFQIPHFEIPHFEIPQVDFVELERHLRDLDVHLSNLDLNVNVDPGVFEFAAPWNMAAVQVPVAPVPPAVPAPPAVPVPPRPFIYGNNRSPEGLYDQARGFIDRDQYDRALESLNRLISMKGARADAAMYWKAYSLSKLARHQEALTTLAEMRKQYANSSWIRDVAPLELEIRQASGQAVNAEAQVSEDMKLLALQGIMRSDPEAAIPVVEKTLAGNSSVRVKERALFVLSQSREPRAADIITNVAKGSSNPDVKVAAIRYMGRMSAPGVLPALEDIYRGTSDVDVKRAVLQALSTARATDRLGSIARNEKDADLRRTAIRHLGSANTPEAAEALRSFYATDSSPEARRAVLDALSSNRNGAAALVSLARAEKDPAMKTEIVRRLSNMRSPEAREYMVELLK